MSRFEKKGKDYDLGGDAKRLLKGAYRSPQLVKSIIRLGTDEGDILVEAGGVRLEGTGAWLALQQLVEARLVQQVTKNLYEFTVDGLQYGAELATTNPTDSLDSL